MPDYECECCSNEYSPIENSKTESGIMYVICPSCKHSERYGIIGPTGPPGTKGFPGVPAGCLAVYDDDILSSPCRTA